MLATPQSAARAAAVLALLLPAGLHASTLARIRAGHTLRCATIAETPEYSTAGDHGPRTAFDAGLCRAIAIAILGPAARTSLTSYPDDDAATSALRAGRADLIPTLTLDLTHAANPALVFSPPALLDAVGFLVPASAGISAASQLSGRKVCLLAETQVEVSVRAWFARQRLDFVPFPFQEEGEMQAAFVTGNCAALAGDLTRLAATRAGLGSRASAYALLPDQVSQDPLAAASPAADPAFARIVTWTLEVLLNAEASGLTQTAAQQLLASPAMQASAASPALNVLTGGTGQIGSLLGLDNSWALRVVAAVGNYGELFHRTLGDGSPLHLPRALNRLSSDGGQLYPLPLK